MPGNPAELLTSPRFAELLEGLRAEYDIVLIDTPPVLAVTDPCVVAPRVDGVVLTIRLSKKSGPQAERAREMLSALGVNILGVVVNGVTRREGSGRYGAGQYEYSYTQNEYTSQADDQEDVYYEADEEDEGGEKPPVEALQTGAGSTPRRSQAGFSQSGLFSWLLRWWA
jgi:Mrp family chromosome partitioning ATPase